MPIFLWSAFKNLSYASTNSFIHDCSSKLWAMHLISFSTFSFSLFLDSKSTFSSQNQKSNYGKIAFLNNENDNYQWFCTILIAFADWTKAFVSVPNFGSDQNYPILAKCKNFISIWSSSEILTNKSSWLDILSSINWICVFFLMEFLRKSNA